MAVVAKGIVVEAFRNESWFFVFFFFDEFGYVFIHGLI